MPYVRISPTIERGITESWLAGGTTKLGLARRYGVARGTIYRVLTRAHQRGLVMERRPVSPIDIAWLAGLVEGEGNIAFNGRSCTIRIKMGDRDIIERAAELLTGKVYPAKVAPGNKPMWLTQIKGANAVGWALTLYSWLGTRRRQQVRDSLTLWKTQGNGVISTALAASILAYRRERYSQAEIMRILKIGKSTVYRHTRGRLPRIRITRQQEAARSNNSQ